MRIRRKLSYGETFNPSAPPSRKCSAVYIAALLFILLSTFAAFPTAAPAKDIYTAQDLYDVIYDVSGNHKLMADIDLTNFKPPTGSRKYWFKDFKGTFDGNGHTIKGLTLTADQFFNPDNPNSHYTSKNYANYDSNGDGSGYTHVRGYGLFASIEKGGVVKNLILEGVKVDIEVSTADVGGSTTYNAAGAIAGINAGTIENCVVKSGSVKIYGGGSKSGVNRVAGGVVGWNMKQVSQKYINNVDGGSDNDENLLGLGKIINCINYASVEANGRRSNSKDILSAGGIAGKSEMAATSKKNSETNLHVHATLIQGCANFGSVKTSGKTGNAYVGGIAGSGESSTDIIFCFNKGAVASEEERSGYAFIGGIIGLINANFCGSELLWCANAGIISALNDDNYKGEIVGELSSPINESTGSPRYSRVENCYWSNGEDGKAGAFGRSTELRTGPIGKSPTMPVYIEAVPTGRATPGGYAGEVQLKIYYADGTEINEADFSQYAEIVGKPTVSGVSADVTTSGQKITAQTKETEGTFSVTAKVKLKQNDTNIYDHHTVTAFFHAEEYVVPVETLTIEPANDVTLSLDATGAASTSLTANLTAYDPESQELEPGNKNIKWSVTEGTCVTLGATTTQSGSPVTLTAKSAGTATITATTEGLNNEGKQLTKSVSVTVYAANVDDTDKAIIETITGGTGSGGATIPTGAQGGDALMNPSKSEAEKTTGSAGTEVVTTIEKEAADTLGTEPVNVAIVGTDESNMKIFSSQAGSAGTDAYWRVNATAQFTPEELKAASIDEITKDNVIVTLLVNTGNGWTPVKLTGLATPDSFTLNFTESGGVNVTVPAIVFDKAAAEGEAIVTPLATDSPHYLIMDGNADGTYKFAIAIAATIAPVETLTVTPEEISLTLGADDSAELTATVTVSDPNDKGLTPGAAGINWQASEGCITLSSTTTQSGDSITVTAQSAGTATITATTEGLGKDGKPLTKTVNVTVYAANVDDTDKAIIEAVTGGGSGGATIPTGAQGGDALMNPSKSEAEKTTGSAGADVVTAIVTNAAEALGVAAGNVAVAGTDESNMKIFSSQADSAGTDAYWRVDATAEFTPEELKAASIDEITKDNVIVTLLVDTGNGWTPVTLTGLATPDSFTLNFTESGGVNVTVPAIVFDKAAAEGEAIVTPLATDSPHYLIMDGNADGTYKFAIAIAATIAPVETLTVTPEEISLTLGADDSAELTATVTVSDPNDKGLTPGAAGINWQASEGCITLSSTTTQSGDSITVTAQSAGTATITATTEGLDKDGNPLTETVSVTVYAANVDDTDKAIIDAIGGGTESGAQIPSGAQGGVGLLSPSKSEAEKTTGSAGADVVTAIVTNAAEALGVAAGNVAVAGTDESNMKIFSSQADSAGTDAYWRVTATAEFTSDELSAANIGDITKETVIVTLLVDTGNGTWEPVTLTGLATPDSFTLDFTEAGGVNVTVPAIVFDKAAQSGEAIVTPMTTPNADGTTTPHYLIMDGHPDCTYKFAIAIAAADSTTQAASGITLDRTILTLAQGDSLQLVATLTPANAANKNVTWVSSDQTVVTVSQDGTVTAVAKEGTATVSAVSVQGGYTASCEVTVTDVRVVTQSENYEYVTAATVYDPGTWPEEVTLVAAVSDKIDDAQKVLDNLVEHGKHDTDAIDGMTHAEPDSVSVLAAFTLSVEHGGAAASGKSIEIDIDLPTAIDIREGYYLYALIAPKTNNEQGEALPFHSFPCTPSQGTNITSLKFTVDDYAAYFTDNHVYLAESKTVPPEQPTTPDSGGTSGGGGGCSAGFGTLALLALVPIILKRRK